MVAFVCSAVAAGVAFGTPMPKVEKGFDAEEGGAKYGRIEKVTYFSKTTGAERKCNVLLPAEYDGQKKFPVLYLLHGIGGDHNEWLQGHPVAIAGNVVRTGGKPCVIVIPNVRAMKDDSVPKNVFSPECVAAFDNFDNDLFKDLMPFIEGRYAVLKGRASTAIAGLSMGGRESLMIGLKHPDAFCAIGAFSPAPGVPLEGLKATGASTPSILMCCGTEDGLVGKHATVYDETLTKNGVAHDWYTGPGGHDFGVWSKALCIFLQRTFK